MTSDTFREIFTETVLTRLFPNDRTDAFFEALYGDIEEGVYDITLSYEGHDPDRKMLNFKLNLSERPGKCLACHLTQGLPEVFSRHPIINVAGIVAKIDEHLGDKGACGQWRLGSTETISRKLYAVPLTIELD
ncbi:MAG: pancreas/duodenum homeobox protein 1 [Desulfurivibrionaceae bacterium]